MPGFEKTPRYILKLIHFPPRLAYVIGLGPLVGKIILLLTTRGRRTGKPRVTPLQYEEIDGRYYVTSALGGKADWVRNLKSNPQVKVQVKSRKFGGTAEIIEDPIQIADFLETRLSRHPRMVGAILKAEGISLPPTRRELETYAKKRILVVIQPDM